MKIIYKDFKKGEVKVKIDSPDDLWFLSTLVEQEDLVSGRAERKIRIGESEKTVKKPIFLTITSEKVEFDPYTNALRVNGKVAEGTEDVPKGVYQTIEIEENSIVKIKKEKWFEYQKKKLEEATANQSLNILILVFDRENAMFALLKKYGYDVLSGLEGDVEKKGVPRQKESTFFSDIIKQIKLYDDRFNFYRIVAASPAFWKDELAKLVKDKKIKEKIIFATCNSVSKNGIDEVLKRNEIKTVLRQERSVMEMDLVDELLGEIGKEGLANYGIDEVEKLSNTGNVKVLLVTDKFIIDNRQKKTFDRLDMIMKAVNKIKGEVRIISSEHEGGKKLDGLGGVAALLRYKVY
jgi:protein pelota